MPPAHTLRHTSAKSCSHSAMCNSTASLRLQKRHSRRADLQADRRALNITLNSIGTELTRDDRRKLYSNFGLLYPHGHYELAGAEDFDQIRSAMEKCPPYQAIFTKVGSVNPMLYCLELCCAANVLAYLMTHRLSAFMLHSCCSTADSVCVMRRAVIYRQLVFVACSFHQPMAATCMLTASGQKS